MALSLTGVKVSDGRIAQRGVSGPSCPSIAEWLLVLTAAFFNPGFVSAKTHIADSKTERWDLGVG